MTNLKLVLRTYSALRQMSPDDIALLETLRALNDGDRELMVETLQGKATTKKASKKSSKPSSSKSPRATGIERQLNRRREQGRESATKDDDYDGGNEQQRCTILRGDLGGTVCGLLPDHNVHHLQSARGFHPFVSSTTAPPSSTRSPANGGASATERSTRRSAHTLTVESDDGGRQNASSSAANSEASAVNAHAAMGGSNE